MLQTKTITWYLSARSALGHCLPCDIINHSTVSTFLKGVYNLRLPTPKYLAIWNVNTLLSHVQHKYISKFYDITKKLATLFMILAGTRVNTFVHLKVANMYITDTEVTFTFDEYLKHSRPNYKQKSLIFRDFTLRDLCPVSTLITYLEHRLPVSGDPALFITTVKPLKKASKDIIFLWVKLTMSEAGINSGLFTSHSCRSASTSKATEANIDLQTILKSANWSGDSTFKKHYLREIQQEYPPIEDNFASKLLEQWDSSKNVKKN